MGRKRIANTDFQTSGSGKKEVPTGDHGGVGKQEQSHGTRHVGTVPTDAAKHDPNFGHRIKR